MNANKEIQHQFKAVINTNDKLTEVSEILVGLNEKAEKIVTYLFEGKGLLIKTVISMYLRREPSDEDFKKVELCQYNYDYDFKTIIKFDGKKLGIVKGVMSEQYMNMCHVLTGWNFTPEEGMFLLDIT